MVRLFCWYPFAARTARSLLSDGSGGDAVFSACRRLRTALLRFSVFVARSVRKILIRLKISEGAAFLRLLLPMDEIDEFEDDDDEEEEEEVEDIDEWEPRRRSFRPKGNFPNLRPCGVGSSWMYPGETGIAFGSRRLGLRSEEGVTGVDCLASACVVGPAETSFSIEAAMLILRGLKNASFQSATTFWIQIRRFFESSDPRCCPSLACSFESKDGNRLLTNMAQSLPLTSRLREVSGGVRNGILVGVMYLSKNTGYSIGTRTARLPRGLLYCRSAKWSRAANCTFSMSAEVSAVVALPSVNVAPSRLDGVEPELDRVYGGGGAS